VPPAGRRPTVELLLVPSGKPDLPQLASIREIRGIMAETADLPGAGETSGLPSGFK